MNALRLALVYAASGVAAFWLVERLPTRIGRLSKTALLLLPLLLTGRAVLTGGFFGPLNLAAATAPLHARADPRLLRDYGNGILNDVATQMIPWKKAVRESVRTGHAPLWNRFSFCGDILLAACQSGAFHPATVVGFALPLATGWTFACSFNLFLAALFAFLYLEEIGLSQIASLFGAAAWMLSFGIVFWIGWPQAAAFAPLPLALLGLRRASRGERGGFAAALAAFLLSLLAGHPESTLHLVSAAGVVFLFDLARSPARGKAVGLAAASGALALALAAPMLLPFAEALAQTTEFRERSAWTGTPPGNTLGEALRSSVGAVLPSARGAWPQEETPGVPSFSEAGLAYVGGLPLALAVLGLASRRREAAGLAAAGLLAFMVATGTPGLTDAVERLPFYRFALNGRLAVVTAFCLSALAAIGLDRLAKISPRRGAGLLAAAVAAMLALALASRAAGAPGQDAAHLALLTAPVAVLALVLAGLSRRPVAVGAFAVGIFLVSHLVEIPRLYPTFPARDFYPAVPEIASLPRAGGPYRVAGLGFAMVPNQSALWELEDPRGYDAITNARLRDTFPLWCVPQPIWFSRVDAPTPFLSLLNTRFLVASPDAGVPAGWRERARGPDCAVFENPNVIPRAFVPTRVRYVSDPSATVSEMAEETDFRRVAWIEEPGRSAGEDVNGPARVSSEDDGPDLVLTVETSAPAWIVVSQTNWKGWRADCRGKRLPVRFADHALLAVQAPAGRSRIRLEYRPVSFRRGEAIAAAALVILIGAAVARQRRR